MPTLTEFLNDLNHGKVGILTDENEHDYDPFWINRFLSGSLDTLLVANEMNRYPHIPKQIQYLYLLHSIRAKKRFSRSNWLPKDENVIAIQNYYGYSRSKAIEAMRHHTPEQLSMIRERSP